jgi:hypothetical protein
MEVLKVIVTWERGLDDNGDASVRVGGGCGQVLAVIINGNEVIIEAKVAINMVLECSDVGGIMGAEFLDGGECMVLNNMLSDLMAILFDAVNVSGVERDRCG